MYVCMYVYIYIYIFCVHIVSGYKYFIYMHTYMRMSSMHTYFCVQKSRYSFFYIHECMYVCMHACMHACGDACTYVYVCVYVNVHICKYIYIVFYLFIYSPVSTNTMDGLPAPRLSPLHRRR